MKRKRWDTGLFLMLLAGVAVAARVYYITNFMGDVEISEEVYNAVKVSAEEMKFSKLMADGLSIRTLYLCSLYAAFLVFGNVAVAGVWLDLAYQVITVLLVFAAAKNVSNSSVGLGCGLVAAVLPFYIRQVAQITPLDLAVALGALLSAVVTGILRAIWRRKQKDGASEAASVQETGHTDGIAAETAQRTPIVDTSMKEIRLDDLEEDKKINYLENPLPVPKRKEHKEMDYEKEITADNDDFDLKDLSDNDDFDIK